MALITGALLTAEQFIGVLGADSGAEASRIEDVINAASLMIENYCERQFVTRGALTEYHSPLGPWTLYSKQYPIISVTSIHETLTRTYDATTLLVENTDYVIESSDEGKIIRVAGLTSGPMAWAIGYRTVKLIYAAGYKSPTGGAAGAALPDDLVAIARRLCARMWKEQERRQWDVQSQSDAAGNFQRFGPAMLLQAEKDALGPYRQVRWAQAEVGA